MGESYTRYVIPWCGIELNRDFRKAENLLPVLIVISTLFTPYAVQEYTTALFVHGFIWYFPFWRLYLGSGESGAFAFIMLVGTADFPMIALESLVVSVILVVGILLAVVVWKGGSDVDRLSLGLVSVFAALVVQICMPVLATLSSPPDMWMLTGLIPVPIPILISIIGLVYIHRINRQQG